MLQLVVSLKTRLSCREKSYSFQDSTY